MISILRKTFQTMVYVQLTPDLVTLHEVKTWKVITEEPIAAIGLSMKNSVQQLKLLGVGNKAKTYTANAKTMITNPFKHPRTILADFPVAELVLKELLKKSFRSRWFLVTPIVIMHPMGDWEGGLTQMEVHGLSKLTRKAGGKEIYIWYGPELNQTQLLNLAFPSEGKVLLKQGVVAPKKDKAPAGKK
jgi:rod shape-determining protein MreB